MTGRLRHLTILFALLAGGTAVAGCGSSARSSGTATWTDGIVVPKGDAGFEFMAQQRRLFQKLGVHVQIESFEGTTQLAQALLAGAIDSAEVDPTVAFKADLAGGDLKIIGSTLPGLTYDIFARRSIASVAGLSGRTIAVSSPGSLPETVVRATMAAAGVSSSSVRIVSVGSDAERVQALLHGRVDATAASAEFAASLGRDSPIHVIASSWRVIPQYPRLIVVARASSLRSKPQAAVRFLAGEMEGIRYALAHPAAERAVAAAVLHRTPTDPGIVYLDRLITSLGAASPTAAIPTTMLRWLATFERRVGILSRQPELSTIVDGSYRRQALTLVGSG